MVNIDTIFSGRQVVINIPNGLRVWVSDDSGDLKTYIAKVVFQKIFSSKELSLGVSYVYICYDNRSLLSANLKGYISKDSLLIIDNSEIVVKPNLELVMNISTVCPVVLIGRKTGFMGLSRKDFNGYVRHTIDKKKIWVGALK